MMSPSGSNAVPGVNSVGVSAPSPLGPVNVNGGGMSVSVGMFAGGSQSVSQSSWTATPTVTEGMSASPGMETNTSQSEYYARLLMLGIFGGFSDFLVVPCSFRERQLAQGSAGTVLETCEDTCRHCVRPAWVSCCMQCNWSCELIRLVALERVRSSLHNRQNGDVSGT